jgi:phosphopantothenate---cysteine ligase (CTP)
MNILITSGGTSEKIDNVRKITNTATGRLGSLIAEEFVNVGGSKIDKIFYVCTKDAVVPSLQSLEISRIESVDELKNTLSEILTTQKVDAVIHTMAVSDYKLRGLSTAETLADAISQKLSAQGRNAYGNSDKIKEIILNAVEESISPRNCSKVSSSIENLVLFMERTPKIIGMIKKLQPTAVLVGFKLLDGVDEPTLLRIGHELLEKNNCDFVLANDLRSIKDDKHNGILISPDKSFIRVSTKQEIAAVIVKSVFSKFERR